MDTLYPEFSAYQPIYAIDPASRFNVIASNHSITPERKRVLATTLQFFPDDDANLTYDDTIDWDYNAILLNKKYFSNDYDPIELKGLHHQEGYTFHSVNSDSWGNEKGSTLSETDKILIGTLAHETGHTVHFICIGNLERHNQPKLKKNSQEFLDGIFSILEKYGVIAPDDLHKNTKLGDDPYENAISLRVVELEEAYVTPLLSKYGSSNLCEFMAECWAEYFLADSPRPLATEVGRLMDEHLQKFMKLEKHPPREE